MDTSKLARPSLIRSLIQLRPETSGAHHAEQVAEVTDALDLPWTQPHRLGKRVGRDAANWLYLPGDGRRFELMEAVQHQSAATRLICI